MISKEYYVINLDYCGFCHGNCNGCMLTDLERKTPNAFYNYNEIKPTLDKIIEDVKEKSLNIKNLVITFGKGNTLLLNEKQRNEINIIADYIKNNIKHEEYHIEISTSLIGKIDYQIEIAKTMIQHDKYKIKFNVVANMDLFSKTYWENIDKFFNELTNYRGGNIDGNGDILVLNVHANKLPPVDFIIDKIKNYRFPVNVVMLPFYTLNNNVNITKQDFDNVEEWNYELYQKCIINEIDNNLINVINNTKDIENLKQSFDNYNQGSKDFIFISPDKRIKAGFFSIYGENDYERVENKLNVNIEKNIIKAYSKLIKNKTCKTCQFQHKCISTNGHINALLNKEIYSNDDACLSGLKKLFSSL